MKKLFLGLILSMFILPMISADIITPGYSPITINNKITNLADYPEYNFLVVGKLGESYEEGMCGYWSEIDGEINFVKEDGTIETPYYKFCQISVYALKKSEFSEEDFKNTTNILNYLNSDKAVKVIEDVPHYKTKPITSTEEVENNFYTISLTEVKEKPDQTSIDRNYLIYIYIGVSILALIVIIFILIKRKFKK